MRTGTLAIFALLVFAAGPYGAVSHRFVHRRDAGGAAGTHCPDGGDHRHGGATSFGSDGCALCKILTHSACETAAPILRVALARTFFPDAAPVLGEPCSSPGAANRPRGPPRRPRG